MNLTVAPSNFAMFSTPSTSVSTETAGSIAFSAGGAETSGSVASSGCGGGFSAVA